jgi:hypothetical protein
VGLDAPQSTDSGTVSTDHPISSPASIDNWVYKNSPSLIAWQGTDIMTAHLQVELAYTMTVSTGGGFSGAWQVAAKCVLAYTPPDYNPTVMFGESPAPYTTYFGEGLCIRVASATPWICVGGISWGVNLTLPAAKCNRYDAGNKGFMIIE